jgi:hypothetical protein
MTGEPNVCIWPDVLKVLDERRLEHGILNRDIAVNSIIMAFLGYDTDDLRRVVKREKLDS